jgi:murein DD-endopeptidase MepM/ murein hydrolase activator NlpD
LVHNADYVVLSIEISDEANNARNAETKEERLRYLEQLNKSLNDLEKFTLGNNHLGQVSKNDALQDIKKVRDELAQHQKTEELIGFTGIPQRDTNKWLKDKLSKFMRENQGKYISNLLGEKEGLKLQALPQHGDPEADLPVALITEEMRQLGEIIFNGKFTDIKQKFLNEKADLEKSLINIKKENNKDLKREVVKKLWFRITTEIMHAQKFNNKYGHLKNWIGQNFKESTNEKTALSTSVPYYNDVHDGYLKYIKPNKEKLQELSYYYSAMLANLNSVKSKLRVELPKNEPVYWGKMRSPVGSDFNFVAAEGSRFIEDTSPPNVWRVHEGLDLANGKRGDTVKATLAGTVRFEGNTFTIVHENGDGTSWKVVYRHMPPHSFKFKEGETVSLNQPIGVVGGWGTKKGITDDYRYAPHMHYEVWEGIKSEKDNSYKYTMRDPSLGLLPGDKK